MCSSTTWEQLLKDVEVMLTVTPPVFELRELAVIMDCYYKSGISDTQHNSKIADFLIEQRYNAADFARELSVNECLKLFRGLFFMDSLPYNQKYQPIFRIYEELIAESIGTKLNMSTWLTVIETARHVGDNGLAKLLENAKGYYKETYSNDAFLTDSDKNNGFDSTAEAAKRANRSKRPKSVLISKKEE